MSIKIIELNDIAIQISDHSGLIQKTSGFLSTSDALTLFGDEAERSSRLMPTTTYSKFWQELSLDTIENVKGFRHFADMAYSQLMYISEQYEFSDEVIFAVPSHFTGRQLAILLGLAEKTPLRVKGVVDLSAAATALSFAEEKIVFVDLQLHQVVLSNLAVFDSGLELVSTAQIPGAGRQNFIDALMLAATNAFIQQCRFNPLHNAESEQQLYNELTKLLGSEDVKDSALEIKFGQSSYTATLPRESLITGLSDCYRKINDALKDVGRDAGQILLSAAMGRLPGCLASIKGSVPTLACSPDSVCKAALKYQDVILANADEGLTLVNRLPVQRTSQLTRDKCTSELVPTHVLFKNVAFPVTDLRLKNHYHLAERIPAQAIPALRIPGFPDELGHIQKTYSGVLFDSHIEKVSVNGSNIMDPVTLCVGDVIEFKGSADQLTLIRVESNG